LLVRTDLVRLPEPPADADRGDRAGCAV